MANALLMLSAYLSHRPELLKLSLMVVLGLLGLNMLSRAYCEGNWEENTLPIDHPLVKDFPCYGNSAFRALYLLRHAFHAYPIFFLLDKKDYWVSLVHGFLLSRVAACAIVPPSLYRRHLSAFLNGVQRLLVSLFFVASSLSGASSVKPSQNALWYLKMAPIMDILSVGLFQLGFRGEVVYGVVALMCSVCLARHFTRTQADLDFKLPYVVVRQLASTAVLLTIERFIRPLYDQYGIQFVWMLLLGHRPHVYSLHDMPRRLRRKDDKKPIEKKAAAANDFPAAAARAVVTPSTGSGVGARPRQAAAVTAAPLTSQSGSTAAVDRKGADSDALQGYNGCEYSTAVATTAAAATATAATSYDNSGKSSPGRAITVLSAAPTAPVAAAMSMTSACASVIANDDSGQGLPRQQRGGPVLLQPVTAAAAPNAVRQRFPPTVDDQMAPTEPRPAAGSDGASSSLEPGSYVAFRRTTVAAAAGGCSAPAAQLLGTTTVPAGTTSVPAAAASATAAPGDSGARPLRGYVGRTMLLSTTIKIRGARLADVPGGYQQRIAAVLAAANLELEGVYMRSGCIELVVDARSWNTRPAGGAAAAAAADVSHRTQRVGWAEVHSPSRAENGTHPPPQGQHGAGGSGQPQTVRAVEASGGGDNNGSGGSGSNPHLVTLLAAATPPPTSISQAYNSGNGADGGGYGIGGGKAVDVGELIRALGLRQDGLSLEYTGSLTDLCDESDGEGASAAAPPPPPSTAWEADGSDSTTMDPWTSVVQGRSAAAAAVTPAVAATASPPQLLSVSPRVLQTRSAAAASSSATQGASPASTARVGAEAAELVLLVACTDDRAPELLVRSHGDIIPATVTSCVSVGAPAGVSVPLRDVLMCSVALPLAALPDEPGVLMVEVRWAGQSHGSALPLLLADDAALAAELQVAVEDWRGGPLELEEMLTDLSCFLRYAFCLLRPTAAAAAAAGGASMPGAYDLYRNASAPFDFIRDRVLELGLHMLAWMGCCLSGWGRAIDRLQSDLMALGVSSAAITEARNSSYLFYQYQYQYPYQQQPHHQQHLPNQPQHRGQSPGDYNLSINQDQHRQQRGGGGAVHPPHDDELYDDVRSADNRKAAGLAVRLVFPAAAVADGGGVVVRHAVQDMGGVPGIAPMPLPTESSVGLVQAALQHSPPQEEQQPHLFGAISSTESQPPVDVVPPSAAAAPTAAVATTAAASYGTVAVVPAVPGLVHAADLGVSAVSSLPYSSSSSSSYLSTSSRAYLVHVVPAVEYETCTAPWPLLAETAVVAERCGSTSAALAASAGSQADAIITTTVTTATTAGITTPTATVTSPAAGTVITTLASTATAIPTGRSPIKLPFKCGGDGGDGRNDPCVIFCRWFNKTWRQQQPESEQSGHLSSCQPALSASEAEVRLPSQLPLPSPPPPPSPKAFVRAACRSGTAMGYRRRVPWALRAVQETEAATAVDGTLRVLLDWAYAMRAEYSCLVAAGYRAFVAEYTAQMIYAFNNFTLICFLILALRTLIEIWSLARSNDAASGTQRCHNHHHLLLLHTLLPPAVACWPSCVATLSRPFLSRVAWVRLLSTLRMPQLLMFCVAGCLIAWGGFPAAAAIRSYQLGVAAFIGDGVVHIAASMALPIPVLLVALIRMPVHMAMWAALGAAFSFRCAAVRAATLACLSVATSVCCHAYLLGIFRRRYGCAAATAAAITAVSTAAPQPWELHLKRE